MKDLLVITPTRGRPGRLLAMLEATIGRSRADTCVALAYDDDDDSAEDYRKLSEEYAGDERLLWYHGPRNDLTGWTNELALKHAGYYRALASLGDDHRPQTVGWDAELLAAIDRIGGTGFAYGNDLTQREALPTAWVVTSDIVQALRWVCNPACRHYWVDNTVLDIGRGADCLAYLEDVIIMHLHPGWGTAPNDTTYIQGLSQFWERDKQSYHEWCLRQREADIETVKACRQRK